MGLPEKSVYRDIVFVVMRCSGNEVGILGVVVTYLLRNSFLIFSKN